MIKRKSSLKFSDFSHSNLWLDKCLCNPWGTDMCDCFLIRSVELLLVHNMLLAPNQFCQFWLQSVLSVKFFWIWPFLYLTMCLCTQRHTQRPLCTRNRSRCFRWCWSRVSSHASTKVLMLSSLNTRTWTEVHKGKET